VKNLSQRISYAECTARERLAHVLDEGSFEEWLPPAARVTSPHLAQLGVPTSFDDGVAVGRARLQDLPVFVAAQEGAFMGGGVGEVHGAKLVGLLKRALRDRGVIRRPEDLGIDTRDATRNLLAARSMRDLVDASGGLYRPPARFRNW
jgi:malonate decarboxylase beta subunit